MSAWGLRGVCIPVLSLLLAVNAPAKQHARGLPGPGEPVPAEARQALLDGSTAFALELHSRLAEKGGNLVFSPLGVATTVGMLAEAARGETREQLLGLLHEDAGGDPIGPAFRSVLSELGGDSSRAVEFRVANALWTRKGLPFEPAFVTTLRDEYGARASSLDFARDPDGSLRRINTWGRRLTRRLVPEVLPPGTVTPDTAFVVTDAVSLRAKWETPFPTYDTAHRPFTLADGTVVQVPTMRLRWALPCFRGEGFAAAELPYRGGAFSMMLLVPDTPGGLPSLEAALTPSLLAEVVAGEGGGEVVLFLPRFSVEADLPLEEPLASLGSAAPFDPLRADFSAAAGEPGDIFLSVLRPGGVIGCPGAAPGAAAAPAAVGEAVSAPPVIAADRPFLFLVRHRATGAILFMGRVVDPR